MIGQFTALGPRYFGSNEGWKQIEPIFGVSRDSEPSHKAFQQKYTLPFPLVADTSGAVQKAYRVPDSIWGKTKRVSFLVGPDGKIARVFPDVDPGVHAKELLGIIATLKGGK